MKVGIIVYLKPEISDKIILKNINITEYFLCKLLSINDVSSSLKNITNLEIILIGDECFTPMCINLSKKYKIKYHTRNHEYLMRDIISITDSYEIDLVTFLTNDCILLDPMIVSNIINKYFQKDTKLIMSVGPYKHTYPEGYNVLLFEKNYLVDYYYKKKPSWEKKNALFSRINFREDPIYMFTDETQSLMTNINFKNLNLKYDEHNSLVLSIVEHFDSVYFGYLHILDYLNNHLELNKKIDYNLKNSILIKEEKLSTLDYLPTKWF